MWETLDVAFVPKFISKENRQFVSESLAKSFKHMKINDKIPKIDIGVLLGAMILRNFDDEEKINELMEEIDMKQIGDEIKIIARDEFKEELSKIEKEKLDLQLENEEIKNENKEIKNENGKFKKGIKELSEMEDLTPEAKKIINSLTIF